MSIVYLLKSLLAPHIIIIIVCSRKISAVNLDGKELEVKLKEPYSYRKTATTPSYLLRC